MVSPDHIARAEAEVRAFIAHHPDYLLDEVQPAYRGGTNCCTFGRCGQVPVVFKSFTVPARWRNERACLSFFAPTGLVPGLIAEEADRLIVMTRLGGIDIGGLGTSAIRTASGLRSLSHDFGVALGTLASMPVAPPPSGYDVARDFAVIPWHHDLRAAIGRYTATARRVQRSLPIYADAFFARSLDRLEREADRVDRQPRCLFHEDIGNTRIAEVTMVGFYDFEMCRLGTHAMQLGVAVGQCGTGKLDWAPLRAGFEQRTGRALAADDLVSVVAMADLYAWIRICYWGWWDGEATNAHCMWAVAADAGYWRAYLEHAERTVLGAVTG
jgi:hypothetical protein